jgi:hypothetical protein
MGVVSKLINDVLRFILLLRQTETEQANIKYQLGENFLRQINSHY